MSEGNGVAIIVHRAERVASCAERHDFRFLRNQSLEVIPSELAGFRIHLRNMQRYATLDHERLPRRNVRVMLEFRGDDLVSWTERAAECPREVIDHRRRVWTENDFVR